MGVKPGWVRVFSTQKDLLTARLSNFEIGKHDLKPEHEKWLKENVSSLLKQGGSTCLVGLASRTGSDEYNMGLSRRRAHSVIAYLRRISNNTFSSMVELAVGERAAALSGAPNDQEDPNWRAVIVSAWEKPTPPPPPPPPPPQDPDMVERRSSVKFIAETGFGGVGDDSKTAGALAQMSADMASRRWGGQAFEEVKKKVPTTHKVIEIMTLRDTKGSINLGAASTSIKTCIVSYKWGVRTKLCLLIDGYWRDGAFINSDPIVTRLPDNQADLWVDDPMKALQDKTERPRLSYDDYTNGKLS